MLSLTCPAPGFLRRGTQEDDALSHIDMAAARTAAPGAAMTRLSGTTAGADLPSEALLDLILASLDDDKAEEVVTISLKGRSSIADYMVICSGRSSRQVASIADKLIERLKLRAGISARVEGREAGDWVLVDAGDVIVHVFRPEVRAFYQLEKMWLPGQPRAAAAAGAGAPMPAPSAAAPAGTARAGA